MPYEIPELSIRIVSERTITVSKETLTDGQDAATVAHAMIGDRPVEHVIALVVDAKGAITAAITVAIGSMSGAALSTVSILRAVLATHGAGFILAHNHPSGDPRPSAHDIAFTLRLREACDAVGLAFLDHVIVTRNVGRFESVPMLGAA